MVGRYAAALTAHCRADAAPGEGPGTSPLGSPDEELVASPGATQAISRRIFWLALLALACAAALAAAGASRGAAKPASLYQRVMAIAGEYRCPVCAGESVASSNAPAAVEVRNLISKWLAQGMSAKQIRSNLMEDYGSSILERPPVSGLDALVWVLPALAAAAGAASLGFAFVRWRRRDLELSLAGAAGSATLPPASPTPAQPTPAPPATAAGAQGTLFDLGPVLPPELQEWCGAPSTPEPVLPARASAAGAAASRWSMTALWKRLSLPAGICLVTLAVALGLVDHFSSPELPGGTITGSVTGLNSELEEAQFLTAKDPAGALAVYQQILKTYPDQPIALTAEGWIFAEAGLGPEALSQLAKAERADPSYGLAHLYRGLVLLEEERQPRAAAAELKWYLAHDPAPAYVQVARRALARALEGAGHSSASGGQPS
jgi:cytochrome c-type biogenesis protein CcmH